MSSSPVYSPRWTSMIDERLVLVVGDPVRLHPGDVDAVARPGDDGVALDQAGGLAGHDHPVLAAVLVGLVAQPRVRVDLDALDLVARPLVQDVPRAPGAFCRFAHARCLCSKGRSGNRGHRADSAAPQPGERGSDVGEVDEGRDREGEVEDVDRARAARMICSTSPSPRMIAPRRLGQLVGCGVGLGRVHQAVDEREDLHARAGPAPRSAGTSPRLRKQSARPHFTAGTARPPELLGSGGFFTSEQRQLPVRRRLFSRRPSRRRR